MMSRNIWNSALSTLAVAGSLLAPAAFATDAPNPADVNRVKKPVQVEVKAASAKAKATTRVVRQPAGNEVGAKAVESVSSIPMRPVIVDVSMDADGILFGTFVDDQGKPAPSEAVTIRQSKTVLTATKTDAAGRFAVKGLKTGIYEVASAKGSKVFRVWTHGTAPKNAKAQALIVNGKKIVRGQTVVPPSPIFNLLTTMQPGTLAGVTAGIAGTTVGVVSINEANDANDRADRAEALIQSLTQ